MSLSEEATFPSKWFLYSFLSTSLLAAAMSLTIYNGWVMWFFPFYILLWSKGLQDKRRGLRIKG